MATRYNHQKQPTGQNAPVNTGMFKIDGRGYGKRFVVQDKRGLHARTSAFIAKVASGYEFEIIASFDNGKAADSKSIISLLMTGSGRGTTGVLEVRVKDEKAAAECLTELLPLYEKEYI